MVLHNLQSNSVSTTKGVPYPICASNSFSVQREQFEFMPFLRSLLPKSCDFLKMVFSGLTHTLGNEELIAATLRDLDVDYEACSYIGHRVVIHTLL